MVAVGLNSIWGIENELGLSNRARFRDQRIYIVYTVNHRVSKKISNTWSFLVKKIAGDIWETIFKIKK